MFSIFEKLGGKDAAIAAIKDDETRPGWPSPHVEKLWRKNKELPGPVVKRLMKVCDEKGIQYQAADFVASIKPPN
jgi:hypothetical protein